MYIFYVGFFEMFINLFFKKHDSIEEPLNNTQRTRFALALETSFDIVAYGFRHASLLETAQDNREDPKYRWFRAVGETPKAVFKSKLFEDALVFVEKAVFSYHAIRNSRESLRLLTIVQQVRVEQLRYIELNASVFPISKENVKMVSDLIKELIKESESIPAVALQGLWELETNKSYLIPLTIYETAKQENNDRNFALNSVLNSEDSVLGEVFFSSPKLKGMLFNIWTIDALESIIADYNNYEIRKFLGYVDTMQQQQYSIAQSIADRMPWLTRNRRQRPALMNAQEAHRYGDVVSEKNNPYSSGNRNATVDPETGLANYQYDPKGKGLSPRDALDYYGNRLDRDVRMTIKNKLDIQDEDKPDLRAIQGSRQRDQVAAPVAPSRQTAFKAPDHTGFFSMVADDGQGVSQQDMVAQFEAQPNREQQPVEAEDSLKIAVGADGRSRSFSEGSSSSDGGGSQPEQKPERNPLDYDIDGNLRRHAFDRPAPQYVNPINNNYDPVQPEEPQQFDWATGLKVGAGVALGAGVLGAALAPRRKKRR
ncbi:MAG: hypothetical protein AAGE99_04675 [Chlamydiota bacterium]